MSTTLLLADDSPTIAKILTMALSSEPYAVSSATTAAEAMQKLQESPPELFLVDISMPEKDGLSFTRWVKSTQCLENTKVVLLTNAFDPVDQAACDAAAVDGIIVKPFDPAELRMRLRTLISIPPKKYNAAIDKYAPTPTADLVEKDISSAQLTKGNEEFLQSLGIESSLSANPVAGLLLDQEEHPEDDTSELAPILASPAAAKQPDPHAPLSEAAQELANFFDAEVQLQQIATTSDELSPTAKDLADFFAEEVEKAPTEPSPQKVSSTLKAATPGAKTPPLAAALASFTPAPTTPPAQDDAIDLSKESHSWPKNSDFVEPSLAAWNTTAPNANIFDVGESSFRFSSDYVRRISRSFSGSYNEPVGEQEQEVSRTGPDRQAAGLAGTGAQADTTFKPSMPSASQTEEAMRAAIQNAVQEILPKIAEKVIREELEKILKSMEH